MRPQQVIHLTENDWSLIPGPAANPPSNSLSLHDIAEYSPQAIADAVLNFPGMRIENAPANDWWQWKAIWNSGERKIRIGMSLFDTEPISWGGSPLEGICLLNDFLNLWNFIRERCPAVWMHNANCEIHTPDSFTNLYSS